MANIKKYFKNTTWLLLDKCLSMTIALAVGIFVARYLQPELMGIWDYALSITGLCGVFVSLGIQPILMRDLVLNKNQTERLLGSAILVRMIFGLVVFLLLSVYAVFFVEQVVLRHLIIFLGLSHFFRVADSYGCLFEARVNAKHVAIIRVSGAVFLGAMKLFLVYQKLPLVWFGVSVLLREILLAGIYIFVGKRLYSVSVTRFRLIFEDVRQLLSQCWPLLLSAVATFVYLKIDTIMIKNMIDDKSVGYYGVAVRLAIAWNFIVVATSQAFYPVVVRASAVSYELMEKRFIQLYSLVIWIAVIMGLLFAMTASWFIPLLLTDSYSPSIPAFQVLCIIGLFSGIAMVSSYWLMIKNMQKYSMKRNIYGMIANVILNLILIPRYGIIGAAIASVMARFTATIGFMAILPEMRIHLKYLASALNPYRIVEVFKPQENL